MHTRNNDYKKRTDKEYLNNIFISTTDSDYELQDISDFEDDGVYYQKKKDKLNITVKESGNQAHKLKCDGQSNSKILISNVTDNSKPIQIICPITYNLPFIFTTKKMKMKIDKLDGKLELHKGCANKKQQLVIQGNILIYNTDAGHIYTSIVISNNYFFSNRPCIPLSLEFEGYIQLNLQVSYS